MDPKVPMENEICPNCKKEVPQQNYLMHVAHCQRNMIVCRVCGEAVPKSIVKEHNVKLHSLVECKDCRYKVQSSVLEHHRKTACGRRQVSCPYCELELPYDDMGDHENYCGSRTERCDECGELVMFKYKKLHLDSNHGFLKLNDEPGPTPSWEPPRPTQTQRNNRFRIENEENDINFTPPMYNLTPPLPQREPITPYDATEDLRAKVKLVRHNLNDIKQSYLMKEERREKINTKDYDVKPVPRKMEKFTTNLVPYEKNISHKINAIALDENHKNFYNYLGEREGPLPPLVPLSAPKDVNAPKTNLNDKKNDKTVGGAKPKRDNLVGTKPKANSGAGSAKQHLTFEERGALTKESNQRVGVEQKHRDTTQGAGLEQKHRDTIQGAGLEQKHKDTTQRAGLEQMNKPRQSEGKGKKGSTKLMNEAELSRVFRQENEEVGFNEAEFETPRRTNGAVPKRGGKGASSRRRTTPPQISQNMEEINLPCEFCDKMIPASELVQHETGCRPDLAQLNVAQALRNSPIQETEPSSPEVELPCEFCFTLYPASRLLGHQQMCGV